MRAIGPRGLESELMGIMWLRPCCAASGTERANILANILYAWGQAVMLTIRPRVALGSWTGWFPPLLPLPLLLA